jgi:hypothetical protein
LKVNIRNFVERLRNHGLEVRDLRIVAAAAARQTIPD